MIKLVVMVLRPCLPWAGASDPQLVCTAHAHGARAVINADDLAHALADDAGRAQWVSGSAQTHAAQCQCGF